MNFQPDDEPEQTVDDYIQGLENKIERLTARNEVLENLYKAASELTYMYVSDPGRMYVPNTATVYKIDALINAATACDETIAAAQGDKT